MIRVNLALIVIKIIKETGQFDGGDQQILRAVVVQFGDLKEVVDNTRHELPGLLVVVKLKESFLQVLKKLLPEVGLHFRAHQMPIIGDKKLQ